jgi:hypothetical protein
VDEPRWVLGERAIKRDLPGDDRLGASQTMGEAGVGTL